jgi:hypothetical protein
MDFFCVDDACFVGPLSSSLTLPLFVFFLLLILFLFVPFELCDPNSSPSVLSTGSSRRAEGVMCLRSGAPMFSVVSDFVIDLSRLGSCPSFAFVLWSPCVASCTVALAMVGQKSLLINEGVGGSVAMKHRW